MDIDGKQKALKFFDKNCGTYMFWKLYSGDKALPSQLAASTEIFDDKKLDKKMSQRHLKESLDLLSPGEYLLQMKKFKSNDNNNLINCDFEIDQEWNNASRNPQAQQPGIGGANSFEYFDRLMTARIGHTTANMEKKQLERDNEELRKKNKILEAKIASGGGNEFLSGIKEMVGVFKSLKSGDDNWERPDTKLKVVGKKLPDMEDEAKFYQELYSRTFREMAKRAGGKNQIIQEIYCLNEYIKENPDTYKVLLPDIMKHWDLLLEKINGEQENGEEDENTNVA